MTRYVLVADAGRARLLRGGTGTGLAARRLVEVETLERPSLHAAKRDVTPGTTGRMSGYAARGRGGRLALTRHVTASDYDPHAGEVARFAKQLARRLDMIRRDGTANDLVLLAEPHFLGALRKELSTATRKVVSKEVSRDFTHADLRTIQRAVARPY